MESESRKLAPIFIAVLLLAAICTGAGVYVVHKALDVPAEAGRRAMKMAATLAQDFRNSMQWNPQISIANTILIQQDRSVLELATIERKFLVRHRWSNSWLHSEKIFEAEAEFTARAGFDLRDPFEISIDPRSTALNIRLPRAKMLSLGMSNVTILRDEDGLWNKLEGPDRERAIKELELEAKKQLVASDILQAARAEMEKRMKEISGKEDRQVTFIPSSSPLP